LIRSIAIAAGATVATLVAVNLAVGGYVARRVIAPRSKKPALPVRIVGDTVMIPSSEDTVQPGRYGIWLSNGAHVAVGEVLHSDSGEVTRELLSHAKSGGDERTTGVWSSQYIHAPEEVGTSTTVMVPLTLGDTAEAWEIRPDGAVDGRWTIHIHGLRSSRFGALRSTPATVRAGWTSLVVSYAGDEERVPAEGRPSSLGTSEWADVEDALLYAVSQGAKEIVLVAWSMGATIALLALEESSVRDRVVGLILVAPAVQWSRVVTNATSAAHLPGTVAAAALHVLSSPVGARALRLAQPVDARSLNWIDGRRARVTLPTLILHSCYDPVVPFSGSADFAAIHPRAQLVEFSTTGHCNEPNQNIELFNRSIMTWLGELVAR
jgi:pimeloyl-ACP methyl ester carboxylesterase